MRTNENNSSIKLKLPKRIKDKFAKYCDENLVGMSSKIRQLILEELKKDNN